MLNSSRGGTDHLESLEAQARDLELRARALTAELRLARGTREVVAPEPQAPPQAPEPPLGERLVAALRAAPASIEELAAGLRVPAGRVEKELKPLRKQLRNVGTDVAPRWFLPPAADATPEQFAAAVLALIRLQPYSTPELQRATGTDGTKQRSRKVHHALIKLSEAPGSRLVRSGDPRRPRWFWLAEDVDLSRFARAAGAR